MRRDGLTVLFVHYDFPSQFRGLAAHYLGQPGARVAAICQQDTSAQLEGVIFSHYQPPGPSVLGLHPLTGGVETHVRRGAAVRDAARALAAQGVEPDLIYLHPGWGEGLFLAEVFPRAKRIVYCEHYYRMEGADVGFDPQFPAWPDLPAALVMRNTPTLMALNDCHAAVSPTAWQRDGFPAHWHAMIEVIHEGVDTDLIRPAPNAVLNLGDGIAPIRAGDEVLTYVTRHFEPYRGFHSFMRALPRIMELRPDCRVVIVGKEGAGYGPTPPPGDTWLRKFMRENPVDPARVHLMPHLPYPLHLTLLQVSACHVYLTYPFVLSWSLVEALSAGCLVVGSDTPPVREVIRHGGNGLLVDFFDAGQLAATVAQALGDPARHAHLRREARRTAVERFDQRRVCLPAHLRMAERVLSA